MRITLSPKWAAYVKRQVKVQNCHSATDLLQNALELLREKDELYLQWEKREVAKGLAQADRGELILMTDALLADIKARGRKRLATRRHREKSS
jgi:Arc/MetJ-type ribon-helix-helix transcriptional regulator